MTLVTMAAPNPLVQLTLRPPITLQIAIYHNIVLSPYLFRSGDEMCQDVPRRDDSLGSDEDNDAQRCQNSDASVCKETWR